VEEMSMGSSFVYRTRIRGVALLAAVALALGLALTVAVAAFAPGAEADHGPPIHVESLTDHRHEFTDDVRAQVRAKPDGRPMGVANLRDASNMMIVEITVDPGAMFPWHTHPGPVLVAVAEGEFEFIFADDCVRRPYKAGEAFVDLGKDVHMALNPSATDDTVLIATFLAVPDVGAITVPVPAAEGEALDAECGIDR
jgi:quercetin dioxygenase-like cupin family protein